MRRADRRIALGFHRTRPSRELLERALTLGVTDVDTAFNYQAFDGHRALAQAAGDLIHEFAISTKVGFFRAGGVSRHSLRRWGLRQAMEKTVCDLSVPPAVVLLHNPEESLRPLHRAQAFDYFADACAELESAAKLGLCDAWGISSWEPGPLLDVLQAGNGCPTPSTLMVRAGLTLSAGQLNAAERLAWEFDVKPDRRWGMSPFAGNTSDPVWTSTNFTPFLEPDQTHTPVQAAVRLAFELPQCTRLAVGTSSEQHLAELFGATQLDVDAGAVDQYRELITGSD
ncbi:aldo/keto reductase [Lentzea albidocapillata]|nr:aldo/keto reductase [Lentzea albidocapillata]